MIMYIILICIVLSFVIAVTIYLDQRSTKQVVIEEKLTDDVSILFKDTDVEEEII